MKSEGRLNNIADGVFLQRERCVIKCGMSHSFPKFTQFTSVRTTGAVAVFPCQIFKFFS